MKSFIYTKEKIEEIISKSKYNLINIITIGDEGKITVSSIEGYVLDTQINDILRSDKHMFFSKKNPHTINNIKLWCKINYKLFILVSKNYYKSRDNLTWKCLKCDNEFEMSWNTIMKNLFGCPYCSGRKASIHNNLLITNSELSKQWDYEKNYPIRPEDVLPNTTKKYWWICDNCNYNWIKSVHNRNQKIPCPNCKMSKGEHAIKSFLEDNNIKYLYEHKFNNCKNIKKLRFDFYLPEHNKCIEYQGEYHYKVLDGISNENILNKQKKCDNIKKDFCKIENIDLLEIPHWEYKNIKNILSEKLK
jgi:rubrerythrin